MDGTFWDKQTENRGGLLGGVIDEKQTKNTGKQRLHNKNFGKALDYNISKNISNLDLSQPIMSTPVDPCPYFSTAVQGRLLPTPRLVLFSCLHPAAGPPSLPPLPCSVDDGCHCHSLPLLCLIMLESHFQ